MVIATKAGRPPQPQPRRRRSVPEEPEPLEDVELDEEDAADEDVSDEEDVEPDDDMEGRQWSGDPYVEGDETDPSQAFAVFTSPDGDEAWLDRAPDGTLTGWVRNAEGEVWRYTDVDAWAVDVDDAGMTRADVAQEEPDEDSEEDEEPDEEEPPPDDTGPMELFAPGGIEQKHLPGRHNQQTHGNRYGVRSAGRLLIRAMRSPDVVPTSRSRGVTRGRSSGRAARRPGGGGRDSSPSSGRTRPGESRRGSRAPRRTTGSQEPPRQTGGAAPASPAAEKPSAPSLRPAAKKAPEARPRTTAKKTTAKKAQVRKASAAPPGPGYQAPAPGPAFQAPVKKAAARKATVPRARRDSWEKQHIARMLSDERTKVTRADLDPQVLAAASDDELERLLAKALDDPDASLMIADEMDGRDAEADVPDDADDQEAIDAILDWFRRDRQTPYQQAREAYELWVNALLLRAEAATRGNLIKPQYRDRYSPVDLFNGRVRQRDLPRIATEELLRFFAEPGNRWLNFEQFAAEHLGWDRRALRAAQNRSRYLSEFG